MTSARRTIAIVENDVAVADSLRALIESAGFHAVIFRTPTAFIKAMDSRRCDCLVLDVDQPSEEIFSFLEDLADRGLRIPTILICWSTDAATRRRAQRARIAVLLQKPSSDALLLDAINRSTCQV